MRGCVRIGAIAALVGTAATIASLALGRWEVSRAPRATTVLLTSPDYKYFWVERSWRAATLVAVDVLGPQPNYGLETKLTPLTRERVFTDSARLRPTFPIPPWATRETKSASVDVAVGLPLRFSITTLESLPFEKVGSTIRDPTPMFRDAAALHRWVWLNLLADVLVWSASFLVLWLLARALFWLRAIRRQRTGLCAACAYDRRGLAPAAACPECGTVPTT